MIYPLPTQWGCVGIRGLLLKGGPTGPYLEGFPHHKYIYIYIYTNTKLYIKKKKKLIDLFIFVKKIIDLFVLVKILNYFAMDVLVLCNFVDSFFLLEREVHWILDVGMKRS